jgi:hypothetical protein
MLIFFLVIAGFVFYFIKPHPVSLPPADVPPTGQPSSPDDQLNRYFSEISGLILLPADEKPTLVNISDVAKLKNQPFFTNAQNGDIVLVFTQSKKAYLYRPSIKKLVEVSPITFAVPTTAPTATPTITPTPQI